MTAAKDAATVLPEADNQDDLLPVRMLNEYAYCPRLFHLMQMEGRWEDNAYTVEGRNAHRRVDRIDHALPDPDDEPDTPAAAGGDEPPVVSRSVSLGSERLGITAKLDLVSTAGTEALPVESKRGRVPDTPERSWEPERVQLMAQGLLLRDHGYTCDHGVLYFAGSRTRVDISFSPELESVTLHYIQLARAALHGEQLPPPLVDSPKCIGCSLAGICLPDETHALQLVPHDPASPEVRRLYPSRDDALPLYVQEQGASVGKSSRSLVVKKGGVVLLQTGLKDISQLVLCGNISVTPPALHLLCEAGIPTVHLSTGHWFYGITQGIGLRNAFARAAQFQAAEAPATRLAASIAFVVAKALNQRTFLRRNAEDLPKPILADMSRLVAKAGRATDTEALLGLEGSVARLYFENFQRTIKPRDFSAAWDFSGRNRRPPRDPVNAMLSFAYALLAKECTVAILAEGLDPWLGLYHRPRHGRPALALDLMEEFRTIIADSAVVTAINTGMVAARDFVRTKASCTMKPAARKALIQAYEARLDHLVTHPLFGYRCSYRAIIRVQAALLARWLRRDIPTYQGMTTR
jgi:CRISPR-associated protein Cas1